MDPRRILSVVYHLPEMWTRVQLVNRPDKRSLLTLALRDDRSLLKSESSADHSICHLTTVDQNLRWLKVLFSQILMREIREFNRKVETLFSSSSTDDQYLDERILKSMFSCRAQWTRKRMSFTKGETMESMIRRFTTDIWKLKIILIPFLSIRSQCSTSTRVSSPTSFSWAIRGAKSKHRVQMFFKSVLLLHVIGFTHFTYPSTRTLPQCFKESQRYQFDEQKSFPLLVWRLLGHLTQGYAALISSSLLESVQHKYLV